MICSYLRTPMKATMEVYGMRHRTSSFPHCQKANTTGASLLDLSCRLPSRNSTSSQCVVCSKESQLPPQLVQCEPCSELPYSNKHQISFNLFFSLLYISCIIICCIGFSVCLVGCSLWEGTSLQYASVSSLNRC